MAIRKYAGLFTPEDLTKLQGVFGKICSERGTKPEEADDLAAALVERFQGGVVDEGELLAGIYPIQGGQRTA